MQPKTKKKNRPAKLGRPFTGRAMEERWSIRLPVDLSKEIDGLAWRTDRTKPAMIRILLMIGMMHTDEIAHFEG